ncbi:MAG: HAMP domain-containing histidine kinase [Oscillochloris sp.]|nr:HAMP domain-containing histidine kinase [Oscillochloris sp.]
MADETDEVEPREVELPSGALATAQVIAFAQGLWAFVLRPHASPTLIQADTAAAQSANPVSESERNESFLANFSNIIRVPLRELRELITRVPAAGELNEQQSRLIGQVVRLNSELTMLVNDLLALGQIRLQASEHRVPLRLDLLIEAAVGTQYAEFGRRGQHVHTEIDAGLPRVFGSEEGLGRAISGLIDNAIKYSPPGAQIHVSAHRVAGDLVVRIGDNGPGLRPEELAQVFDPFYRAESTERLGISGRGLGLTIAKAVIEQHDGKIWAEGAPGQGCAFSFRLPAAEGSPG